VDLSLNQGVAEVVRQGGRAWARFHFSSRAAGRGHIYLARPVEQILAQPDAGIHFFHSTRAVDEHIWEDEFAHTPLPAVGLAHIH
jgi:hypothetical protein